VQYFERFIDERLDALNRGVQIDNEFDKEIKNIETYRLGKAAYKPPEVFQNAFSNVTLKMLQIIYIGEFI
jgi:hypothetical protein